MIIDLDYKEIYTNNNYHNNNNLPNNNNHNNNNNNNIKDTTCKVEIKMFCVDAYQQSFMLTVTGFRP